MFEIHHFIQKLAVEVRDKHLELKKIKNPTLEDTVETLKNKGRIEILDKIMNFIMKNNL